MLSPGFRPAMRRQLFVVMFAAVSGLIPGAGLDLVSTAASPEERPQAQQPSPITSGRQEASAVSGNLSEQERAIRAVDEEFVRDYNKGDVQALAARFTQDAEVEEAEGDRYQGRNLIEQSFANTFAASPGARMTLEVGSIRFLTPDIAKEEGRTTVTPAKGGPVTRFYTVLYVKQSGRWLIASVREENDPSISPHEKLKDLAWMVGEWVDEAQDSVVHVSCRWSEDENFLLRTFHVKRQGKPVMTVSQRIGWDPRTKHIRSWEFDSEGGFGEGTWSRDGDRWVVKHSGVRPEGTSASATNLITRERPDLVRWVSTDRVMGDEVVAGEQSYVLVRVPPPPGAGRAPQPTTPSNARRSVR